MGRQDVRVQGRSAEGRASGATTNDSLLFIRKVSGQEQLCKEKGDRGGGGGVGGRRKETGKPKIIDKELQDYLGGCCILPGRAPTTIPSATSRTSQ